MQPKKIKGFAPLHMRATVGDMNMAVQLWGPVPGNLLSSAVISQCLLYTWLVLKAQVCCSYS